MDVRHVQALVAEVFAVRARVSVSRDELSAGLSAIARLRAVLDGVEADLTRRLGELSSFPEAVVAEATRSDLREAARRGERVSTLDAVPVFVAALESGSVSGAHVDALTRTLRSLDAASRAALVARADTLVVAACRSTVDQFATRLKSEAARLTTTDSAEARLAHQKRAAFMKTWVDKDSGMWSGKFAFDPVTGLKLHNRLEAMIAALFAKEVPDTCPSEPSAKQDHLRALALIALTEPSARAVTSGRAEISLVVDRDCNGDPTIDCGLPVDLPPSAIREACAQAVIYPVVIRDGVVVDTVGRLDLGRTARVASAAQRRALRVMYPTCAIPGCQVRYAHTKPHHVQWWRHGGLTDLDNLVPLCSQHHHRVHDKGWQLKLRPDRTLIVTLPDGTQLTAGPTRQRGP